MQFPFVLTALVASVVASPNPAPQFGNVPAWCALSVAQVDECANLRIVLKLAWPDSPPLWWVAAPRPLAAMVLPPWCVKTSTSFVSWLNLMSCQLLNAFAQPWRLLLPICLKDVKVLRRRVSPRDSMIVARASLASPCKVAFGPRPYLKPSWPGLSPGWNTPFCP